MTTQTNKQLVRRLYEECIGGGKLDLLPRFIADEYVGPRGDKGPSHLPALSPRCDRDSRTSNSPWKT